jgi:tetratricopeptide (TPR) repeat protein
LWEKCHDLPVEANEALHSLHALRWNIFPDLADYLESRGLVVRGRPDDFSVFLEHLPINRIREISNQLGTDRGRSKAGIISKILTNTTQEQLSIILPEINEPWIKEFRKPFDSLSEEWLEYTARVANLIETFVREKFMTWKSIQHIQENRLGFVVEIDWECPSYCRLPERCVENTVNISIKDVPPWFPGCGCLLKYDSILGDEIKTKLELSITTGMTVKIVEYNDSSARIELLNLYGSASKSADGRYCLMYSEGWWLLIESNIIKAMGHMAQPNYGALANNGTFILTDDKFRRYMQYTKDDYVFSIPNRFKGGIFWVIGKSGQPLIRRTCTANIGTVCISPEGGYAACSLELDDSNTADSETVVLFDLNICKQISQFNPSGLHINQIEIDENERVIKIADHGQTFKFNFNGELLDTEAWDKANIENANGYNLLFRVEQAMKCKLTAEEEINCLELLNKALRKGVSLYYQGAAYLMMGQIHEGAGQLDEAVKMYEVALERNPRLAIKRHLKQLRERI